MRKHLGRIAARIMYTMGAYNLRRRLPELRGKRLLVLMYHDLAADASPALGNAVDETLPTASQFAAHVREARRHFRVIALRDAVAEINNGGLREDTVCITFDDGYASVHSVALPVLKRLQAPATVFVLTGWVNRELEFWWHRLRAIIETASFDNVSSGDLQDALGFLVPRLSKSTLPNQRYRAALAGHVEGNLRDIHDDEREEKIERMRVLLLDGKVEILSHHRALTWDQLEELERNGIELAAHTHSHINMRYADDETVRRELTASKNELEKRMGHAIPGFAYPYGKDLEHYRRSEDLLREIGFEYACTAFPGHNSDDSNLLALRRISAPFTTSAAMISRALFLGFTRDNEFYKNGPTSRPPQRTQSLTTGNHGA